ncbi:SRPBCC family protein [Sphingobacterium suaedae]|uniref:SRPBCC domain-containing protein n=1 Tax=Sphingobacterium suaedae TaxID=1686402 RepID=A0ABW5KBZ4_9SPHI
MTESAAVLVERTYSASLDTVWDALTDKAKIKAWYFEIPEFELQEGAEFDFYEPGEAKRFQHHCKILAIKPKQLLRYSWSHPSHSQGASVVSWHLMPRGNATTVRLVHEGIETFADAGEDFTRAKYEKGWSTILGASLAHFLEDNK